MSILWCGGEDIDFPVGGTANVDTTATRFRSGYARCGLTSALGVYLQSKPFVGGAITDCWFTFQMWDNRVATASALAGGLVLSSTVASGLWVGGGTTATKLALFTYDGTTKTQLAAESGNSLSTSSIMHRIDLQLVSYGATSTINVYCDGTLVITFSGDCRVGALTNVDAFGLSARAAASNFFLLSEIVVADEDVRAFPGLLTMALTGAGTTDDWTGTFSNINGTTISDANPAFVNLNDKLEEFNVTDLPSGTFAIKAVKIAMRAAKAAGTPTKIALGYNEGGTVTVESDIALTTAYATYEQLDNTNPRTSAAWDSSIINALQITAKSRA
jgi:hypothetical protein